MIEGGIDELRKPPTVGKIWPVRNIFFPIYSFPATNCNTTKNLPQSGFQPFKIYTCEIWLITPDSDAYAVSEFHPDVNRVKNFT